MNNNACLYCGSGEKLPAAPPKRGKLEDSLRRSIEITERELERQIRNVGNEVEDIRRSVDHLERA